MARLSIRLLIVAPCGDARRLMAVRNFMEFAKGLAVAYPQGKDGESAKR
jgi:hypothetical protein